MSSSPQWVTGQYASYFDPHFTFTIKRIVNLVFNFHSCHCSESLVSVKKKKLKKMLCCSRIDCIDVAALQRCSCVSLINISSPTAAYNFLYKLSCWSFFFLKCLTYWTRAAELNTQVSSWRLSKNQCEATNTLTITYQINFNLQLKKWHIMFLPLQCSLQHLRVHTQERETAKFQTR